MTYEFLFMHASGEQLRLIADLVDAGSIRPVVGATFAFDQTRDFTATRHDFVVTNTNDTLTAANAKIVHIHGEGVRWSIHRDSIHRALKYALRLLSAVM